MFKFNMIKRAIDCTTGEIIPAAQIVDACLEDKLISLVFHSDRLALVSNGIVMTSTLQVEMLASLEEFVTANVEVRAARKLEKELRVKLKEFYVQPVTSPFAKVQAQDVIELEDIGLCIVTNTLKTNNEYVIEYYRQGYKTGTIKSSSLKKILSHYPLKSYYNSKVAVSLLRNGSIVILRSGAVLEIKGIKSTEGRVGCDVYKWSVEFMHGMKNMYTEEGTFIQNQNNNLDIAYVVAV